MSKYSPITFSTTLSIDKLLFSEEESLLFNNILFNTSSFAQILNVVFLSISILLKRLIDGLSSK